MKEMLEQLDRVLQSRCFFKLNLNCPDQFNFNKELKISFRIKWINKQGSINEWTGSIFCRLNWKKKNPCGYWREKIIKIVTPLSFNKHWSNLISRNSFAMKSTRTFLLINLQMAELDSQVVSSGESKRMNHV